MEGPTKEYPLSVGQERIWFEEQIEPGTATYNVAHCYQIRGEIDLQALERSLRTVVDRHEVLRTVFGSRGDRGAQIVGTYNQAIFSVDDFVDLPQPVRPSRAMQRVVEETRIPFDLRSGPLARMKVYRLGDEEHILSLTIHHLVCDGSSISILLREISEIYNSILGRKVASLPPIPIQYGEYSVLQRKQLEEGASQEHIRYFREYLGGTLPSLNLPTDRVRPPIRLSRGAQLFFQLDSALFARLGNIAAKQKVTRFMLLLGAFETLLFRYTGQEDVVIGAPIAGRIHPDTFNSIGFFVNTIVLRTSLAGNPTFLELLRRSRDAMLKAINHQELPFEELVRVLNVQRDLSRTPLFQVMFVQNPVEGIPELGDAAVERIDVHNGGAKCDLTMYVSMSPTSPRASIEYSTDLFDAETITRMAGHYVQLLESIADNSEHRLSELPMLTRPERKAIIEDWNSTEQAFPRESCIHELFESQVKVNRTRTAVVSGETRLTYDELNRRANQLAHRLIREGSGPEVLVGLCVERSEELIVGMLAILKTGGAYLPLDPGSLQERARFILEQSQISIIVTESRLAERLAADDRRLICVDIEKRTISEESDANPGVPVKSDNLAYVMYTSGSTGTPKGVAIEHRNTVAFVSWASRTFADVGFDGVLASSSVSFDLSIFDIILPLCNGGKVILLPNALHLSSSPAAREVRLMNTVPPVMGELLKSGGLPPTLTTIALGGDVLPMSVAQPVLRLQPRRRLFTLYGPTETTTYSTCIELREGDPITIGRPIDNTRVYVLDPFMNPVPVGVYGEIFIGGAGVARGYYRQPDLTKARFVDDPFNSMPGARLYRTGDFGRFRADGTIEFLGRKDDQAKIRGFRVEPDEVASILGRHPGMRRSVVVCRPDPLGDKRLIAFCQLSDGFTLCERDIREFAHSQMPEYMVPSRIVIVNDFPLTPNGKIDRQRLVEPEEIEEGIPEGFRGPQTPEEATIAGIYCEVLQRDRIDVRASFFDLGGHSLLAMRVISRVRNSFGVELPLRSLFEFSSVTALASRVRRLLKRDDLTKSDTPSRLNTGPISSIEELSDADVDSLLKKLLLRGGFKNG